MPRPTLYRSLLTAINKRFGARQWFPQLPLALIAALIGILHLIPLIEHTLGWPFKSDFLTNIRRDLVDLTLWGVPQSAIGGLLLIMSLGLLWRSRIAWITCLITVMIGLLLQLDSAATPVHWWRMMLDGILLVLLLPAYRLFDRHNMALGTLFALASIIVFTSYAVFGTYRLGDHFKPPITDLANALYFIVVSISSVGYGDITPGTAESRLFLVSVIILGITIFSTALGATLVPAFLNRIEKITHRRHQIMKRSNHYIIVGHSSLASNTYHELTSRGEQVTVIVLSVPEGGKYADIDIVTGDGSDVEILKKAGGEEAKAIMALLDDDSENAFVVLAAKELKGGVKTVAAVNDVKNINRIRRVHPYLIIAPQVLGGELLTMALTGEKIESSTIMQRLMGQANLHAEK